MTAQEYITAVEEDLAYSFANIDIAAMEAMCDKIVAAGRVFITGAGRSLLLMRCFGMMLKQIGFEAYIVGDVTTPACRAGDILIAGSFSGKTRTTRMYVECAKNLGATVALWTAHKSSPIADLADSIIVVPCGTGEGRPSKQWGGYDYEHALFPLCDILAWMLCERIGADESTMKRNHANIE